MRSKNISGKTETNKFWGWRRMKKICSNFSRCIHTSVLMLWIESEATLRSAQLQQNLFFFAPLACNCIPVNVGTGAHSLSFKTAYCLIKRLPTFASHFQECTNRQHQVSSVASPKILGDKRFVFRRITLFCLGYRLSKHKMAISSKNLGGPWPARPPGYTYTSGCSFRLWCVITTFERWSTFQRWSTLSSFLSGPTNPQMHHICFHFLHLACRFDVMMKIAGVAYALFESMFFFSKAWAYVAKHCLWCEV